MKPVKGYNDAQIQGDYERLAAGGYVISIEGIKHDEKKKYLQVIYDIAEGAEAGRYRNETVDNDFRHAFIRSYKETALGMFKAFIRAIDETNGTKFDETVEKGLKESELVGKKLGVVFGYEEYEANDGKIKERLYVKQCCSADKIRQGDYKVPELKKLSKKTDTSGPVPGFTPLKDEDVPF